MDFIINAGKILASFIPTWIALYIIFRKIFRNQLYAAKAFGSLATSQSAHFYKLCCYTKAVLQQKAKTTELMPEEKEYFQHCHAYIDFYEKNFSPPQSKDNQQSAQ